jgi:DNA-binding GntR family transcriptional regulator
MLVVAVIFLGESNHLFPCHSLEDEMAVATESAKPSPAIARPAKRKREKSLLKQQAYVELKRLIQDTTFPAGEFLSERQLAARLGMSKTPVRAALERLEAEGFIAVAPQQGIVVREMTVHEMADQFEIREALESFVLRTVAGMLDPQETARVRANLDAQKLALEQNDVARIIELDADFHIMFCEFLGNGEIIRVMSQLREKIHRVISRVLDQDSNRLTASYDEHCAIAEAVFQGDAELAAKRLEEHLEYGKQFLLSPRRR